MLVVAVTALCVPPVFAQATGTVKGVCKDMEGKPIVGANVEWVNTDNGRKYNLKTNKKGEYFSLGIEIWQVQGHSHPGRQATGPGQQFSRGRRRGHARLRLEEVQAEAAQQKGITPEQLKQMQEQQAKAAKETNTVKALNEKLAARQPGHADGRLRNRRQHPERSHANGSHARPALGPAGRCAT